ncbi:MAG: hypothetical protein HQL72_14875 [Magnetococcales bacterium]|nr:hypothetical protein [Magnetococcales bacterium]
MSLLTDNAIQGAVQGSADQAVQVGGWLLILFVVLMGLKWAEQILIKKGFKNKTSPEAKKEALEKEVAKKSLHNSYLNPKAMSAIVPNIDQLEEMSERDQQLEEYRSAYEDKQHYLRASFTQQCADEHGDKWEDMSATDKWRCIRGKGLDELAYFSSFDDLPRGDQEEFIRSIR